MSMVLDGARFACARSACWVYVLQHECVMREAQCNVQPVFTTLLKLTLHDRIASNHHAQSQRRAKRSIGASTPSGAGGASAAFTVAAGRRIALETVFEYAYSGRTVCLREHEWANTGHKVSKLYVRVGDTMLDSLRASQETT